jgi:succinate dehydrogenase/fumarate reductase cytochrome b subunit
MYNKDKVISPSLTLYVGEMTSIISIFERITGVILFFLSILYYIFFQLRKEYILSSIYYDVIYCVLYNNGIFIGFLTTYILFIFIYHVIMGLRYLYWNNLSVREVTLDEFNKVKINKLVKNLLYFILFVVIILSI